MKTLVVSDRPHEGEDVVCTGDEGDAIWHLIYHSPFSSVRVDPGKTCVSAFLLKNARKGRWRFVPDEVIGDEVLFDLSRPEMRDGAYLVWVVDDRGDGWISSSHRYRSEAIRAARLLDGPLLIARVRDASGVHIWPEY